MSNVITIEWVFLLSKNRLIHPCILQILLKTGLFCSTYEETERRSRQVETLKSKNIVMSKMFESKAPLVKSNVYSADRAQLMGVTDLGTSDWGANDEDDELLQAHIATSSIPSVQQQQQEILKGYFTFV